MTYKFIASSVRADRRNDEAHCEFTNSVRKVSVGETIVVDGLEWVVESVTKIWSEDEIKNLVQTNDQVLYGALTKLYDQQTAEEKSEGITKEQNGRGFNGLDSGILSSMAEFLKKTGFLTTKQIVIARKKLVKYTKQLTMLANA